MGEACANCPIVPVRPTWRQGKAYCGKCGKRIPDRIKAKFCCKCGQMIHWAYLDVAKFMKDDQIESPNG